MGQTFKVEKEESRNTGRSKNTKVEKLIGGKMDRSKNG